MERRNHKFSLPVLLLGVKMSTALIPSNDNLGLAKLLAHRHQEKVRGVQVALLCLSGPLPVLELAPFPWAGSHFMSWELLGSWRVQGGTCSNASRYLCV